MRCIPSRSSQAACVGRTVMCAYLLGALLWTVLLPLA